MTAVEFLEKQLTLALGDEVKSLRGLFVVAKEMDKKERMYSKEEVNEIIAEAWNSCEDNEGETFTEVRKRILEQYKK